MHLPLICIDTVGKDLLIPLTVWGEAKMFEENKIPEEDKVPENKTKKEIKIQDLKPKKDVKGGGGSGGGGPGIVLPGSPGIPF